MLILVRVFVLVSLVCLSGCMTFELEGAGKQTPKSQIGRATVHGSLYGFEWSERKWNTEVCTNGNHLRKAEFHTNILYLLASTLSLGLYVPQSVDWWCEAPPPGRDGKLFDDPE